MSAQRKPTVYQKPLRRITKAQLIDELIERHGSFKDNWAFACPVCGQIQTVADFINIDVDPNTAMFACIGRYIEDRGCDWILSGDQQEHTLEVIDGDNIIPCFEIA